MLLILLKIIQIIYKIIVFNKNKSDTTNKYLLIRDQNFQI